MEVAEGIRDTLKKGGRKILSLKGLVDVGAIRWGGDSKTGKTISEGRRP